MRAAAIVPAAGLSTRMGSTTSGAARKQLLQLQGAPVFIHALRRLDACPELSGGIYLPVRPEDRQQVEQRLHEQTWRGSITVLEGGETRQDSVWRAFEQIPPDIGLIAVHDAVRPFLETELVTRVLQAAERWGAAIAAIPAMDTIKQVERASNDATRITATLPRERIVLAQTPQAFHYELLRRAFVKARAEGFYGTDESALIEHLGEPVYVVAGSPRNLKITTPADLELAEMLSASAG